MKTLKSKHRFTLLRICELRVKGSMEDEEEEVRTAEGVNEVEGVESFGGIKKVAGATRLKGIMRVNGVKRLKLGERGE